MSIRPLDMQVMVPKLQEVAQLRQAELQRSTHQAQDASHMVEKNQEKVDQTVTRPTEEARLENRADAKEKGNNTYEPPNRQKKKKADSNEPQKPSMPSSGNKIDIRI